MAVARTLRSARGAGTAVEVVSLAAPPATPQKKRSLSSSSAATASPSASPKKPKVSYKQWEQHLAEKHAVPSDLSLPQAFISRHSAAFVDGLKHILTVDPSLYPLIINDDFPAFLKTNTPATETQEHFARLCRSVIGQQVSGAAAKSIETKFKALFGGKVGSPQQVLATADDLLRSAGLSARKAEYVKSIAQKFVDGEVDAQLFDSGSNDEIIQKLVEMKGIGEWSAKMFLVFALQRLDVFAHDDLGVARGVSRYLETRPHLHQEAKLQVDMSLHTKKSKFHDNRKRDWKVIHDAHVNYIADKFQPYRSVFMLVMWRASATDIGILED